MSELVDRVARAMCQATLNPDSPVTPDWPDLVTGEARWKKWVPIARAALTAMREPTKAMIEAHTNRSHTSIPGTGSHFTDEGLNAWHAMIDEALK